MTTQDPQALAVSEAVGAAWWPVHHVHALGAGHIHGTWLVAGAGSNQAVVQRISTTVFNDPGLLMDKVARVVRHVADRAPGWVPELVPTRSGGTWYRHSDGTCWRMWTYLGGARTLQVLSTPGEAAAAGAAFGRFQALLGDFAGPVPDAIPGFMQLEHYLRRFDALPSYDGDGAAESETIATLRGVIDRRRDLAARFRSRDRLIHADCKVNNLLFAPQDARVVGVLDLDTVMFGHWAWDAGDLIRSACAAPDGIALDRFEAVVRGMRAAAAIDADPHDWVLAPCYVTLMLAIRFLTDHLEGDRYFRVAQRGDNLRRAREQFHLLHAFERDKAAMLVLARTASRKER